MDSDLWISRLMAAKRQYALQRAQHHQATTASYHDRFGYDDIEPEDEVCPDFQCPYCYEDHGITSLCAHLEDEHPFESKVVACPVCSARVSKDLLDHLTLQHGCLFKLQRHHRLRRVPAPSNHALSIAERDQQETYLKALLEDTAKSSASAVVENWFRRSVASKTWKTSPESNLSHEERERRRRRAAVKASFVQHLLVSNLFDE